MIAVDLSPILDAAVALAASALGVFGSLALRAAEAHWHIQVTQAQNDDFDDALNKAITAGAAATETMIAEKGYDHPAVKSSVLNAALTYVAAKFPAALAGAGLSGNLGDPANARAITAALTRAYPAAMTTYSNSPVTPNTPLQAALVAAPSASAK
jgi:hypothetical protein